VILLTRLNGQAIALNSDLLERAEATPDTVLTLLDGSTYVVRESLHEVIGAVREFRASVVALSAATEQVTSSPQLRAVPSVPVEG
jgi:flagellar protein FlbD